MKKPKQNENWDESLPYIIGVGSYQRSGSSKEKSKTKQIGFIRQKPKARNENNRTDNRNAR